MTIRVTDECAHCGLSVAEAFRLALMREMGASTSRDPIRCGAAESAEHDFRPAAASACQTEEALP